MQSVSWQGPSNENFVLKVTPGTGWYALHENSREVVRGKTIRVGNGNEVTFDGKWVCRGVKDEVITKIQNIVKESAGRWRYQSVTEEGGWLWNSIDRGIQKPGTGRDQIIPGLPSKGVMVVAETDDRTRTPDDPTPPASLVGEGFDSYRKREEESYYPPRPARGAQPLQLPPRPPLTAPPPSWWITPPLNSPYSYTTPTPLHPSLPYTNRGPHTIPSPYLERVRVDTT